MKGYSPESYGDSFDDDYEEMHAGLLGDQMPMTDVLARYAGPGPVLELGIGSGRVARPLAVQGIEVDGIEISAKMIEQLRRSAKELPIRVLQGDFSEFNVSRSYPLIYCVWSTFFFLTSKEAQARAFDRVARTLTPDGVYVLETYVGVGDRFDRGQEIKIVEIGADSVTLQFARHYPDTQIIECQRVVLTSGGAQLHPVRSRYSSVEELDKMAHAAGLRLRNRWADWSRAEFTQDSPRQLSVYEAA